VSEETYGEDCGSIAQACTMLLQGPKQIATDQMKDAVNDGLRAV
jgi:chaperonin GroEL (HSP60 family)